MTSPPFEKLAKRLSKPKNLATDFSEYPEYLHDATDESGRPSALVFAANESDVIEVAKFCQSHRIALVPRGAGTGLSGGCVPSEGSLVLSTERLKKLEVDVSGNMALVGPGVITKDLQDEAE